MLYTVDPLFLYSSIPISASFPSPFPLQGRFLTAGTDGWLRWWSFEMIDSADISDEEPVFEIEPLAEIFIGVDGSSGTESKANGSLTEGAAAGGGGGEAAGGGDALVVGGAEGGLDGIGGGASGGGGSQNGIHIKSLLRGTDHWMILDARGGLWRLDILSNEVTQVAAFHAGAVTGMDTSPVDHFAASTGNDGTVRCYATSYYTLYTP